MCNKRKLLTLKTKNNETRKRPNHKTSNSIHHHRCHYRTISKQFYLITIFKHLKPKNMTQIIFVQNDTWNSEFIDFITKLQEKQKTPEEQYDLICKYADVYNVRYESFRERSYGIELVNGCVLIYRGQDHLLTVKFEL